LYVITKLYSLLKILTNQLLGGVQTIAMINIPPVYTP